MAKKNEKKIQETLTFTLNDMEYNKIIIKGKRFSISERERKKKRVQFSLIYNKHISIYIDLFLYSFVHSSGEKKKDSYLEMKTKKKKTEKK